MSKAKIGLDDVLLGINQVAFGNRAFLRHPNIREILLVTNNRVIKKIAGGLGSGLYGNISIRVFTDRDAALAYATGRK